ncbi:MAG: inositol monophosphatase family protein [Chloroflexota bacterium]|nr:inositol monophosphatase family protein [Chloroflexota bacterium]
MKPNLKFVKEISLQAGQILQSFVGHEMGVQHKGRTDLVTKADRASEEFLIHAIRKAFPNHAINAEESGEWEGNHEHQWFIDPLDGTLNFAHGVPIYSVSVGYACKGEMTLGVVYDPTRNECFYAERGQGAEMNGQPLHVSNYQDLIDCMLFTGFPNNKWGSPTDNTDNFLRFSQFSQTVRRLGSAALAIAYIAAGRLDGFWEIEIFQWDVAAGGLIAREAGGVVTDIYGDPDFLRKPVTVVCANPTIHSQMLDVLAEVRAKKL